MKKSLKFLIIIGLILLAVYFFKYQFSVYFPGCNLVYASYLNCVNYPNVGKCGKQTSVTCGLTFLGDLGSSQTTKCDFGYQTNLGFQSVVTLNYGETYSFFADNRWNWYIWGYYCPLTTTTTAVPTTTTTTYPTTTTTIQPITTTTTYPTTTTIPYYPTTTTTTYPTTTTTIPPLPEDETYLILGSLVALAVGLPVAYLLIRKKR